MTIDRNRIKLELLNFRNYAEIYADSRNLITEYERNDNKITTAERHDIRLTKLEKNAKAKIPFKELFDRYAELKRPTRILFRRTCSHYRLSSGGTRW